MVNFIKIPLRNGSLSHSHAQAVRPAVRGFTQQQNRLQGRLIPFEIIHHATGGIICGYRHWRGHSGRVVTLSPSTSEAGVRSPSWP